jgi:hypothetical protein
MTDATRYHLTITRNGPTSAPYGWEIREHIFGPATKSCLTTFQTRIEALTDSARAAVELGMGTQSAEGEEGAPLQNVTQLTA